MVNQIHDKHMNYLLSKNLMSVLFVRFIMTHFYLCYFVFRVHAAERLFKALESKRVGED